MTLNHLTHLPKPRRLARMLTASTASPNPNAQTTPKPENWSGVTQGFKAAKKAFHAHALPEAEKILLEILEFAPVEPKAWAWLGHILKSQGQPEEAEKHFQKAKQLLVKKQQHQEKEAASLPLARILWQQGEHEEARSMLKTLLSAKPADKVLLQLSATWGEQQ